MTTALAPAEKAGEDQTTLRDEAGVETPETFEIADLFCGAGGTSEGVRRVIEEEMGARMELRAINHWPVAIETHQANHPHAHHLVEDVSIVDPEAVVPDGYLDLLLASPECRFYSRARGGKPVLDQGRMNPWGILRWLTSLDVRITLVENVPEFTEWGPLLPDGRPDKSRKGVYFQAWVKAIWDLGYSAEWRMLNAADYGDATTRVRFFLMARKDGRPIVWPEPTHARGDTGMFPGRRPWRAASDIIDWTNPGRSILDDPRYLRKPLSEKTRMRIARGLEKFCGVLAPLYIRLLDLPGTAPEELLELLERAASREPQPLLLGPDGLPLVPGRHGENGSNGAHRSPEAPGPAGGLVDAHARPFHGSDRQHTAPRGMGEPLHTITTLTGGGDYLVSPETRPFVMANRNNNAPRAMEQPLPGLTTTTGGGNFLVEPGGRPFLLGQQSAGAPRDVGEPVPTITAAGAVSLVQPAREPFLLSHQRKTLARSTGEPVPAITCRGPGYLVEPIVIQYYGQSGARTLELPLSTIATNNKHALVQPSLREMEGISSPTLVEVNHQGRKRRTPSLENPLPALTTRRAVGLANPAIIELAHGNGPEGDRGNDRRVHSPEEPLGSITTSPGLGLAQPILSSTPLIVQTSQTGGNGGYSRPADQPVPTLTTRNDVNIVTPTARPFVVPNFGEREGQSPRVHDLRNPVPAVTSRGAGSLVTPALCAGRPEDPEEGLLPQLQRAGIDPRRLVLINGQPFLLDIRFRMLMNSELARAMGFTDEEYQYEFTGNVTQVTKQIGNAVPVRLATALVREALRGAGRRRGNRGGGRRMNSREELISLQQLHHRGWNNRLVWQLLGLPDVSRTDQPFPRQPGRQLYQVGRVLEASRREDFQPRRLASLLRDLWRFGRGLEEEIRWAQALPVRLDLPGTEWEELVAAGLRHREELLGREMPGREDPGSYRVLAGYSELKHHHTNYDDLCRLLKGRRFASYTYPVVLHRVNRMLLDLYPQCLPRVKGARRCPTFRCHACGVRGEGEHNGHYHEKPRGWLQRLAPNRRSIRDYCSRGCALGEVWKREAG